MIQHKVGSKRERLLKTHYSTFLGSVSAEAAAGLAVRVGVQADEDLVAGARVGVPDFADVPLISTSRKVSVNIFHAIQQQLNSIIKT